MTDDYWIVRHDIGVKCFPRCASTTILKTYGYGQSCVRWMTTKRRFIVVRDPVERLWSAFNLYRTNRYGDVPELGHLNDLLKYIVERTDEQCDVHVRSMTAQLQGYEPKPGELIEMKRFLNNPPIKINPAHEGLRTRVSTQPLDLSGLDKELYKDWISRYYNDVELYRGATET